MRVWGVWGWWRPFIVAGVALCSCGRIGYDLLPEPSVTAGAGSTRGVAGKLVDGSLGGSLQTGAGGTAGSLEASVNDSRASDGSIGTGGSGGFWPADAATGGASGGTGRDSGLPLADASRSASSDGGTWDAASTCAIPRVIADGCLEIPPLPAAPVLDGELDCGLTLLPLTPEAWTGAARDGGSSMVDAIAEYAVGWRPDGLYVFVSVNDPTLIPADPTQDVWDGDGVDIYVDSDGTYAAPPAYDNPGTRELVVGAPGRAPARTGVWSNGAYGSEWTSAKLVVQASPRGYVVEAFVTAADLGLSSWALGVGAHVGFDLSIDVSYPDPTTTGAFGHRLGQYFLKGSLPSPLPDVDVTAFCNPVLDR